MQARSTTTRHWPHHQEVPQPLLLHDQGAPSFTVRFRSAHAIDGVLCSSELPARRSSPHDPSHSGIAWTRAPCSQRSGAVPHRRSWSQRPLISQVLRLQ